jgi:predicted alpha/beta hydrolase
MKQESIYITFDKNDKLHLRRIYENANGIPVFMLHGAVENGRIFYSESGRGLAPYLAQQGYDVFIGDLRGRGQSIPTINRQSNYGQTESILYEIPAFINKIKEIKGDVKQHWMGHSWGGVLLLAYLARFKDPIVLSMVFWGTKRRVSIKSLEKFYKIDLLWDVVPRILKPIAGYLPVKELKMGADNESKKSHRQSLEWVRMKKWIDSDDGYNYHEQFKKIKLPPTLYLTGKNDKVLGHPTDVNLLMEEIGPSQPKEFKIIGKQTGHLHDYDHINLLTHKDAVKDHFPMIVEWLKRGIFTIDDRS